jgi:NADPH:quinone reductase-like Zn-dependent oxidoreductase
MEIQGSTFLVSGGGSGLGAATVRTLAEAGARVLIADVNEEAGGSVAAEIGEKAKFVRTDVTDETSVQDAVDAASETFGGLQGAVNCAGIGPAARMLGRKGPHPLDLFEAVIRRRKKQVGVTAVNTGVRPAPTVFICRESGAADSVYTTARTIRFAENKPYPTLEARRA